MIKIELFKPHMLLRVETFLLRHSQAKICHHPKWTKIVEELGLKSYYLVVFNNEEIKAILPLAGIRSKLFGDRIISQAYSNYGGQISDSLEASTLLYEYTLQLITKEKYKFAEFRNLSPIGSDVITRTDKVSMYLGLEKDPEKLWLSFNAKVRNQVRKAEKSNLIAFNGGLELLKDFYNVYTVRMRQLGTPAYPLKLMYNIMQTFPNNCRLFIVRLNDITVGAGFTISFNNLVEIPWAATLIQYNNLCPNNLLYWEIMKYYCIAGVKCFDFGRCTLEGSTYQFKKQWDAEPVQLYYQYISKSEENISILKPQNHSRKIELWKKTPLWLTRIIGPYVSKQIP